MSELLFGFMPTQLVYVMARLRIPDRLAGGPMTLEELSSLTECQPAAMSRLVRGLENVGLVRVDTDHRISLTEMGALLGPDAPGSMRDVALHFGGEGFTAWSKLDHAVRTGEPAFDAAFGEPFFRYLERNSVAGDAFDGTMTRMSRGVIAQAVASYDFSAATRILDIAGGRGHFVAAVLAANSHARGAVFDQPHVATAAAEYLADKGLGDRCEVIGGSFFEPLPTGYDLHILKWILHDWNDQSCRMILGATRSALPTDGRLLVVEQLLPDAAHASAALHPAILSDLNMLVNFGDAVERSLSEYESLLGEAGFALDSVIALASGFSILECRPHVA